MTTELRFVARREVVSPSSAGARPARRSWQRSPDAVAAIARVLATAE